MTVIIKKDKKVEETINLLPENYSIDDFINKFIEVFPEDWKKLEKNYSDHIRKTKEGKKNPMPEPKQYLKNALNVFLKKEKDAKKKLKSNQEIN